MRRGRAQPCLQGVSNLSYALLNAQLCRLLAQNLMTKVTREDSMTKVIQSFQGSDLQPLNARLLRGEVDPWETLPLNNPPFHWAKKTQLCQNGVFP